MCQTCKHLQHEGPAAMTETEPTELSRLTLMCRDHEVIEFTWNHAKQAVTGKTRPLDVAHAPIMSLSGTGVRTKSWTGLGPRLESVWQVTRKSRGNGRWRSSTSSALPPQRCAGSGIPAGRGSTPGRTATTPPIGAPAAHATSTTTPQSGPWRSRCSENPAMR